MPQVKPLKILDLPVYYINLDKDIEKRESIESLLEELGFTNVNRFSAKYHSTKGLGCAMSHNRLLKDLSGEQTPFIVLEDDVIANSFKDTVNLPLDADAFYLGNSMWGIYNGKGHRRISVERYTSDVFRIYNMLAAHAILYNNPEYVKFLARATEFPIYVHTNQDKARAETMKYWNVYAGKTPLFYQDGKYEGHTKFNLPGPTAKGPSGAYTLESITAIRR